MLWRLGFAGPWNFLTQKQAACLWGQSCESLGWCHIARLSTRLSPSQWRDQLPAASVQRHPWDIFQDSPGGRWCYNVSWSPIVFCLVSRIFKIPDEASIDHAFYDLAYAAGQCNRSIGGLAWSLFDLGIRITFAALHWWGKSPEIQILFRISFRIFSVSSGRCFNGLLWIPPGQGARGLAFIIDCLKSLNRQGLL